MIPAGRIEIPEIRTDRLLLRRWRESDLDPFSEMNADSRVMEFLLKTMDRSEVQAMIQRIEAHFEKNGFGFYAVEVPGVAPLVGMAGLAVVSFEAAFTPCVEIGWRFAYGHWGKGYATEAARSLLEIAFSRLGLDQVVSFTVPANRRSRAVMERIGMIQDPAGDFDHPRLPEGHPLRRHVLYSKDRPARTWRM